MVRTAFNTWANTVGEGQTFITNVYLAYEDAHLAKQLHTMGRPMSQGTCSHHKNCEIVRFPDMAEIPSQHVR